MDDYLQRAYALGSTAEAEDLYNEWAEVYDEQLTEIGYATPQRCVEALVGHTKLDESDMIKVLDAGCGTGLVGKYLARSSLAGHFVLDGIDISSGMLEVARNKATYRELCTADLNKKIDKHDSVYDAIVCCGTLTKGHVGPEALTEFVRLLRKSGTIVATVHEDLWESGGFKAKVESLQSNRAVEIVSMHEAGILENDSHGVRMVILRKI